MGQLSADRQREAQERRRAQATQVNMWLTADEEPEPGPGFAHVLNTSQQPVYEVLIEWWPEPGLSPIDQSEEPAVRLYTDQLMPGKSITSASGGLGLYVICRATFRDAAGVRWRYRPDGELVELA